MNHELEEGIRLFNGKKYFEAHEALEAVWLKADGEEKLFLHGLIQIAAAFHHHTRGNHAGFRSLLEKGWKKLEEFGDARDGLDLANFRQQLQPWRNPSDFSQISSPATLPPLPRLLTTESL